MVIFLRFASLVRTLDQLVPSYKRDHKHEATCLVLSSIFTAYKGESRSLSKKSSTTILTRILDVRTYKEDFNEEFHKLDLSGFLIRGSERVLAYYDAIEIWSSTFDSHLRSFVPGTFKHYLTRNKKYI